MDEINFETFEAYLFEEDKQEFLNKLIPNTEPFLFFSLLHTLNTSPHMTPSIENKVKKYNQEFGSEYSENLYIRALLKKFDDPLTTQKNKQKVLDDLKQYLNFSFNYSKPSDIITPSSYLEIKKLSSCLDPNDISIKAQIEEMYDNFEKFSQLKIPAYSQLDIKRLINADLRVLERFVFNANPSDFDDFPHLILTLLKKKKAELNYVYPLFSQLSLEQLSELEKLNPEFGEDSNFVEILCYKEFHIASFEKFGKDLTKQEKRDLMLKLYRWSKQRLTSFNLNLINSVLYEILQLDLELNRYEKELFIEFLKSPGRFSYDHRAKSKQDQYQPHKNQKSINIGLKRIKPNNLVKLYLEEFFKTSKDTKPFKEYLDSDYVNEIFYSTKLMLGQALESKEVLSSDIIKELSESKELSICRYNPEYYKATDQVSIALAIKNIPSLMIKVFL